MQPPGPNYKLWVLPRIRPAISRQVKRSICRLIAGWGAYRDRLRPRIAPAYVKDSRNRATLPAPWPRPRLCRWRHVLDETPSALVVLSDSQPRIRTASCYTWLLLIKPWAMEARRGMARSKALLSKGLRKPCTCVFCQRQWPEAPPCLRGTHVRTRSALLEKAYSAI